MVEKAPLLFLDVEGVIGEHVDYEDKAALRPVDFAVENLRRLYRETACDIILSAQMGQMGLVYAQTVFVRHKIGVPLRDVTPKLGLDRGHDIHAWMQNNPCEGRNYCILDDCSRDFILSGQQDRFVEILPGRYLNEIYTKRAIELLQA